VKNKKTFIGLNLSVFMMMLGVGMIMALLPKRIIVLTGSGATVGYLASRNKGSTCNIINMLY